VRCDSWGRADLKHDPGATEFAAQEPARFARTNTDELTMTIFFETTAAFGACLRAQRNSGKPVRAGFRTRPNGHASLSFDEAKIEAIGLGWSAVKRIAIDRVTFAVVFVPRPAKAHWSAEDIAIAQALIASGKMTPEGIAAVSARGAAKSKAAEDFSCELSPPMLAEFKRHPAAWTAFQRLSATQRTRRATWVMTAKQEKTRSDRFAKLLMDMSRPRK
jgi:uncharacterized protein YdeI (YjbR/CyaY-like superfamily)